MGLTRIRAQQITDTDYKQAVRVATDVDITLTGGAPVVVDGVTLQVNNRVLVRQQTDAAQNGLYVVSTVGVGSNGTWVRSSDADQTGEISSGMVVMVTEGVAYADVLWKLTTNGNIVVGQTELSFEQVGSGGSYTPNNILGTVSQSSGVPTGAIIEQGSNANGNFVRYADGTQICFVNNVTAPVANTLTSSSHSWPAVFSVSPMLGCAPNSSVIGTTLTAMTARAATTTGYTQTILRSNTTSTALNVIAIGRWF